MPTRGELRIDPGSLPVSSGAGCVELAVLYTEWQVTEALLRRVVALAAGLDARILLVAVHAVPYPADFECHAATHAHLVETLMDLATPCPLPVRPLVVVARSHEEGFQFALPPESTVLIGGPQRLWRTAEDRLARTLAGCGHKVALLHVP